MARIKVIKYSAEQIAYKAALDLYEATAKQKFVVLKPFDHLLDSEHEADIDLYTSLEEKANTELGLDKIRTDLRNAQDAMIDWAMAKVRASAVYKSNPKYAATMDECIEMRSNPIVHRTLVDLSYKLAA